MNESDQMISDDEDCIIEEGISPIWKWTEFIHDTIADVSEINQEENGPIVNPFENVVNDNLEEAAIQKEKNVMGMIEPCMDRVEILICNQVEKIILL